MEPTDRLTVAYDLEIEDVRAAVDDAVAATRARHGGKPAFRADSALFGGALIATILSVLPFARPGHGADGYPAIFLGAGGLLAGLGWSLRRSIDRACERQVAQARASRDAAGARTTHEVVFDAGGLSLRVGGIESRVPWSAVAEVHETPTRLVLRLDAGARILVPRRAFGDDDAWRSASRVVIARGRRAGST